MTVFDRPVGAAADLPELEYCLTLMKASSQPQSTTPILVAKDVQRHLMSRHGISVSREKVQREILQELVGAGLLATTVQPGQKRPPTTAASSSDSLAADPSPLPSSAVPDLRRRSVVGSQQGQNHASTTATSSSINGSLAGTSSRDLLEADNEPDLEEGPSGKEVENDDEDPPPMDLVQFLALILIPELLDPSPGTFSIVLSMLLERFGFSTSKNEASIELTKEKLSQMILKVTGEEWDDQVVEEMLSLLRVASSESSQDEEAVATSSPPVLNEITFEAALTLDVAAKFPLDRQNQPSTHYQDALSGSDTSGEPLKRVRTVSNVDQAADTFFSFWWSLMAWLTLFAIFSTYLMETRTQVRLGIPGIECESGTDFGCNVMQAIVRWLIIFVELSVFGTAFILLVTLGNSVYSLDNSGQRVVCRAVTLDLVGMATVIVTTILAYVYEIETGFFSTDTEGDIQQHPPKITLSLGVILLVIQLALLARHFLPSDQYPLMKRYLAFGCQRRELWTKQAAGFKLKSLLYNSFLCYIGDAEEATFDQLQEKHSQSTKSTSDFSPLASLTSSLSSNSGSNHAISSSTLSLQNSLLRFHSQTDRTVSTGGALWVWRRIFTGRLFYEDGVWIFPRLVASNVVHWFVCGLLPAFWVDTARSISVEEYDPTGTVQNSEVQIALAVGALMALSACLSIAFLYVPSAVSTILRFRSGVIGSLRDPCFDTYRKAPDTVTNLFGAAFWGSFITAIVCWAVVGGLMFLMVWVEVRVVVVFVWSNIIGFSVAILLKILVLRLLRRTWINGFYRRNPAPSNIMNVILQCWNLGLAIGHVVLRSVKLILLSLFFIGRIDTPFLAPGISRLFGKLSIDDFPDFFRRDLLIHEAHRHPYIERAALLYLLKLRHGPDFGQRAGAAWRTLFVLVVCPWVGKYRWKSRRYSVQRRESGEPSPSLEELCMKNEALEQEVERLQQSNDELRNMLKLRQQLSQKQARKPSRFRSLYAPRREPSIRSSLIALGPSLRAIFHRGQGENLAAPDPSQGTRSPPMTRLRRFQT